MQTSIPPVFDRLLRPYETTSAPFTPYEDPQYIPEAGPYPLSEYTSLTPPQPRTHHQAHFHHQQRRSQPRRHTSLYHSSPYPLPSEHQRQTQQSPQQTLQAPQQAPTAPTPSVSSIPSPQPPAQLSLSPQAIPYASSTTTATSRSRTFTCWDHGCCGRNFSCAENYRRHCREKELGKKVSCARCGSVFTRKSNRDAHLIGGKCAVGAGRRRGS